MKFNLILAIHFVPENVKTPVYILLVWNTEINYCNVFCAKTSRNRKVILGKSEHVYCCNGVMYGEQKLKSTGVYCFLKMWCNLGLDWIKLYSKECIEKYHCKSSVRWNCDLCTIYEMNRIHAMIHAGIDIKRKCVL